MLSTRQGLTTRISMRQSHKTILIWAILILMFVSIYSMFTDSSSKEKEVDVTDVPRRAREQGEGEGDREDPRSSRAATTTLATSSR